MARNYLEKQHEFRQKDRFFRKKIKKKTQKITVKKSLTTLESTKHRNLQKVSPNSVGVFFLVRGNPGVGREGFQKPGKNR
jgi:hypothetical protein